MFCEVERAYIEDGFNLYGLRGCVGNFLDCLDLILDRVGPDDSDESHLTQNACTLYGLIHARYIITAHGLDAMYNKYASKDFGTCPLVNCSGQPVLPLGLKDEVGYDSVKVYCPKCQRVYSPPPTSRRGGSFVDGAAFGTTFPHLFLMTFNNLAPDRLANDQAYVPRVFGFRVHRSAHRRLDRAAAAGPPAVRSRPEIVAAEVAADAAASRQKEEDAAAAPQRPAVDAVMKGEGTSAAGRIAGPDNDDPTQGKRKNSGAATQKMEKTGNGEEESAGSNTKRSKR